MLSAPVAARQNHIDRAAARAAGQVYAYTAVAEDLAAQAALLADDGLRSASNQRSGSGGHAQPVELTAMNPTLSGGLALRIRSYLSGMTDALRTIERLDRERHQLVQTCRPADPRLLEVHVTVPYCLACDQPVVGRRRSGYDDACYRAWLRWPKTTDPGRDRFTFEPSRRGRQPAA